MNEKSIFRWLINPWVIGGALIFALLLLAVMIGLLLMTRPGPAAARPATAVLNVIPAPTATPRPTITPTLTLTPTPDGATPAPGEGNIQVGSFVQVAGTGGDGLRIRTEPGLISDMRILGAEGETFQVTDGPRQMDGYTWWYLEGAEDTSRSGWAVANYLALVQGP